MSVFTPAGGDIIECIFMKLVAAGVKTIIDMEIRFSNDSNNEDELRETAKYYYTFPWDGRLIARILAIDVLNFAATSKQMREVYFEMSRRLINDSNDNGNSNINVYFNKFGADIVTSIDQNRSAADERLYIGRMVEGGRLIIKPRYMPSGYPSESEYREFSDEDMKKKNFISYLIDVRLPFAAAGTRSRILRLKEISRYIVSCDKYFIDRPHAKLRLSQNKSSPNVELVTNIIFSEDEIYGIKNNKKNYLNLGYGLDIYCSNSRFDAREFTLDFNKNISKFMKFYEEHPYLYRRHSWGAVKDTLFYMYSNSINSDNYGNLPWNNSIGLYNKYKTIIDHIIKNRSCDITAKIHSSKYHMPTRLNINDNISIEKIMIFIKTLEESYVAELKEMTSAAISSFILEYIEKKSAAERYNSIINAKDIEILDKKGILTIYKIK